MATSSRTRPKPNNRTSEGILIGVSYIPPTPSAHHNKERRKEEKKKSPPPSSPLYIINLLLTKNDWGNQNIRSIAEHAIGLIVACMPVIPAFFRHIKSKRATTQASSTAKESWKPSLGSNSLSYRASGRPPRGSTKDPYLLSRDYKELDDLESANALTASSAVDVVDDVTVLKGGGTTTTIIEHGSGGVGGLGDGGGGGGGGNTSRGVNVEDREKGGRGRKAEVMVSRSVQVESHPIGQGPGSNVGIGVMPPAHLKR